VATFPTPARFPRIRRFTRRALVGATVLALASQAALIGSAPAANAAPADAAYGAPDTIAADYYGALLRHTRWVNSVWDPSINAYQLKDFNFAVVLGNAVLLTHGDFDEQLAGISKQELRTRTIATIDRYAASNRFVNPNGDWGKRLFWDSTFQSYFLDAGRVLWDDLSAQTRSNLETIAKGQSAYTADLAFGNDPLSGSWTADWPTGKYEGDTAQEEAGVYTQALAPGLAWAPNDPDAGRWADQLNDWARNAAGQPTADRNNPAVTGGEPISTNTMHTIHDTYLVENHGSFGPHYQSDIWRSGGRNAIQFILNDQPLPEILTHQPNSAELWESVKMVMSDQGEPFMPMVEDREYLYGRDVLPMAFLGQVLRDPDAARAEANLAAALEDYQTYAPVDRLAKFSGEPKYEPEARAEIAISYLLHVEAAESAQGVVDPTPQDQFFERLSGVRDFGDAPDLTVQQSPGAWAAAVSRPGFVKFPWAPQHDSWLFDVSGTTPFLYPSPGAEVSARNTGVYTGARDGFEATASEFTVGEGFAGQVTLPTGAAVYASSGAGPDDGIVSVRNLDLNGYNGLDGSRTYLSDEGSVTEALPVTRPADPLDASAARVDDHEFEPVTARYVRMQGQEGNPKFGYSMYSFHVYGDPSATSDIAAGKAATASSEDAAGGRNAAKVTDATASSRWAVAADKRTTKDSWIQVDLGAEQTVSAVRLAWEASAGVRYLVQTSTNGTDWTTQAEHDASGADANVARLDTIALAPEGSDTPAPVEAQFVRMQGVRGDPGFGYSLYHFRAFTPEGVDAAAKRPASASSADTDKPASAVTDGSATTRWAVSRADRTRPDSWIQVDLGAPTPISTVQLGWEAAAGREFRIQTSLDGTDWTDAASFRYTGERILSTDGSWLNVENKAGFVVRGSDAPITVSREVDAAHNIRLADGGSGSFLVELVPGDADKTLAQTAAAVPVTDSADVQVSLLDGYLSAFNLSSADVTTTVTIPHGESASVFAGEQTLGADSSSLTLTVPAATAVVLAPRATVAPALESEEMDALDGVVAKVGDGRTVTFSSGSAVQLSVKNAQTGESRIVEANPSGSQVRFDAATAFPVADLALETLTFPASVLPTGMTSPSLAVDGDPGTAWVPGADGRMVVDLGRTRDIGAVAADWTGRTGPDSVISVSDDGFRFRDIGPVGQGVSGALAVAASARYVAITTEWRDGDASLTSLRILPPDAARPGPITGELPTWQVGRPATGKLMSEAVPAVRWSVSGGSLPDGVTLDATTGEFAGTPTLSGKFEFTVSAANGVGDAVTRAFTVDVSAAPAWTVKDLPSAKVGAPYEQGISASGNPSPTYEVTDGKLPDGLALDGASGSITGTPTRAGEFDFTVSADNGVGLPVEREFTLTVLAADALPGPGEGPGAGNGSGNGGSGTGNGSGTGSGSDDTGDGSSTKGLSNTGVEATWYLAGALALVAGGFVVMTLRRRRLSRR
jgi:hypothetical protein